jgi:hypothetical protein
MKLTIKDLSRNEVLGRTEMAGVRGGYRIAPFGRYSYDLNLAKLSTKQENNAIQSIDVAVGNQVAAFDSFRPHVDVHTTLDQDNKVIVNQR